MSVFCGIPWPSAHIEILSDRLRNVKKLDDENMDRLHLVFKLTAPEIENPPQLCWEANKGSQYGLGWFKVMMIIDYQGIPTRFEVLANKGVVFSANVSLGNLKSILVEAFTIGPYFAGREKPETGILLNS